MEDLGIQLLIIWVICRMTIIDKNFLFVYL